jgi:dipeptidyl aminopeptidase/acylaminoacyl peptidase
MSQRKIAPYGSWASPIDARQIAEGTLSLGDVRLGESSVYWIEHRPAEGGRYLVVERPDGGEPVDRAGREYNARTRVHEYGGAPYLPIGEAVVFAHFVDQRLYRVEAGGEPVPITPAAGLRYADMVHDARRDRIVCIREDHRGEGEAVNTVAAVPLAGGDQQVLVGANDFYASPRISPDGKQLAYLTWNHPDMPWDAAELRTAPIRDDGSLGEPTHVAGGEGVSIVQPEWSPDGTLHFISDRTDWWNLYRLRDDGRAEALTQLEAEFAAPLWRFGGATYGFVESGEIVCAFAQRGRWRLARLDVASRRLEPIDTPYTYISCVHVRGGRAAFVGGSSTRPTAVVTMDVRTGRCEELRRATETEIDAGYLSAPEAVEFPTTGGRGAFGLYYAPQNIDYAAPADEKPPLVVMAHGGPTSATATAQRLGIQYYTSRGIAVLDVDYGGSTGYGRAYRQRLCGQWGIVDVDDCCNGAGWLAEAGKVDGRRLAITGGSAGGYTTLACLAFRDVFAAGSSHFGVSDCEALAVETHKFESRYLDGLIGPYPQRRDLYVERSPIHHVDSLSCPVIFFQGLEDKIVPPNQARRMADALRAKGIPLALIEFEGEQHGFRQADTVRKALEAELYFFSRIFGFDPAGEIEAVEIENL